MPIISTKQFITSKQAAGVAISRWYLLLAFAAVALIPISCKKAVQQQAQNIIIDAMTNGRWYVEQYKDTATDVTGDFFGYEFQFYQKR